MSVMVLCVVLSSLIHQTEQDGHLSPVKNVSVYAEETDISHQGAWVLNVAWRDEFVANAESDELMYDIEVLLTEQMRRVHYETIQVKPGEDVTTHHQWKWTSPLPLQCTSHSVRLRRRDQHKTGDWSPLYTYKGQDLSASEATVYPHDQDFLVGSNITFCCILKAEKVASFSSSEFTIRISNRTYITNPVHFHSPLGQINLECGNDAGTTVFIGYPPDDQNLTCVTYNLSSVECHWDPGRATHIEGERGETKYTLNGRDCQLGQCVLPTINVKNWTLIAKNSLGVKIISDTAEPLHRVWLRAPRNILSRAVYERNATLEWGWDVEKYSSFSMICQVELNGHIYKKTFSQTGLTSIGLIDLQPFADYTAKVHCGSSEHFYVWSDWSDITHFRTKEDIPDAVDVWMQYLEQNTHILWKPLTNEQSYGVLTGYEITVSDSENKSSRIHIDPNTTCYSISAGNETRDQKISVLAKNSAGLSAPASIIIPNYPGSRVNISHIKGSNGGFEIFWEESSSYGYVVDWFPTYSKQQCAVEWRKVPSGHLSTRIQSDIFQPGVIYTVSVYSCTAGAPQLLQRREGYAVEQRPSGPVQNLTGKLNGKNLVLSWKEVPLDKQGGFIQGYIVITFNSHDDSKTPIYTTITKKTTVHLTLDPGSYTINVAAFTSAGEGVTATYKTIVEKNTDEMIMATVLGSSVAAVVFFIITILCYRKRMWVKKMLYPDIPEPKLSGHWVTKAIYCSQMTEGYMKCEIQEVHSIDHPATSQESTEGNALIRSNSILCPTDHLYQSTSLVSSFPPETSSITSDPFSSWRCAENNTSIIENPTYNMTWPESVNVSQISGPTLEIEDSYLPAPNVVCNTLHDYKPQSLLSKQA